jgi:hypothetical protein
MMQEAGKEETHDCLFSMKQEACKEEKHYWVIIHVIPDKILLDTGSKQGGEVL